MIHMVLNEEFLVKECILEYDEGIYYKFALLYMLATVLAT